jgi:transposase/IS5 family transposase
MHHVEGCDRDQAQLLPARVDDYVHRDNPVRFIDAFVDDLDLNEAGFARVEPKDTGRPAYDPADLLKLYIYGYVNRVRSSRRLETEAGRNLEVIWLLCGLRPDFKTIADFRKDNRNAFKAVFRQFVLLCRKLDLFGRELVAVDGTRLKAVNSTDRNFTREKLKKLIQWADERLADYLSRLDRADSEDGTTTSAPAKNLAEKIAILKERRGRYAELSQELERTGESQISLTDPDSRAMASYPKVGVGYNAQVAVDAKHKLIVAQEVTNAGSDLGLLAQTAGVAKEVLGVERIDAVADKGYYKGEDIQACEEAGIDAYVARPQRGSAVSHGLFRKEEFRYDAGSDTYLCPGGQRLEPRYHSEVKGHALVNYCNPGACRTCPLRPRCTPNSYRRISRWANEAVLDRMAERLAARPEILRVRRETVEHPFGSIKQWMNQGYFLMRGLEKVRAEFSLTALAYNLTRAVNLVGIPKMLAAL